MFLSGVGAKDDPNSGGRQMPSHWGHKKLNIVSQSSPTGTQCLQAIGCAEAGMLYERVQEIPDRPVEVQGRRGRTSPSATARPAKASSGKRSRQPACASFPWSSSSKTTNYAISVPVEVQTPGGNISKLVESFPGLAVHRCDGTDFLDSYRTMKDAVAWCRARKGPAFVHATCIRPYSHSLSDDERLYKTPAERAEEAKRDPIPKFAAFLKSQDFITDEELAELAKDVDREIGEAADAAIKAEKPSKNTAGLWVLARRGSDVLRVRHGAAARRQGGHDGRGHQPDDEGRDGGEPAHHRLR